MKYEKLIVKGFRQFRDRTEFDFSTSDSKKLTLIHGENSVGKTTLLNAMLWCLAECTTPNFRSPSEKVYRTATGSEEECVVELFVSNEGNRYRFVRKQLANSKNSVFSCSTIDPSGNQTPLRNPYQTAQSLMPVSMAPYFFYDGEGFRDSTSSDGLGQTFQEAVRNMLGFSWAKTAEEHLTKLRNSTEKKLANSVEKMEGKRGLEEDHEKITSELSKVDKEISSLRTELNKLKSNVNYFSEKIKSIEDRNLQELEASRDDAIKKIDTLGKNISHLKAERRSLIHSRGFYAFASRLSTVGLAVIDRERQKGKFPAEISATVIDELLDVGRCICGRPIGHGSEEERMVVKQKERSYSAADSDRAMWARDVLVNFESTCQDFVRLYSNANTNILRDELDLKKAKQELTEKDTEIEKLQGLDLDGFISQRSEANESIDKLNSMLESKLVSRVLLLKQKEQLVSKLKGSGSSSTEIVRLQRTVRVYEALISRAQAVVENEIVRYRIWIQDRMNHYLKSFLRTDHTALVTEDFNFHYVDHTVRKVAPGQGASLLLNMAFVCSLMELAKERSQAKQGFLVPSTVCPLVIDAPFGHLDQNYQKKVGEMLTSSVEQLVLLLSSSHWGPMEGAIREYVGSEYILENYSSSLQENRSSDEITILDKSYQQSFFNATSIETKARRI